MCIFIKKNGKKVAALTLVPLLAINIYVGSRIVKINKLAKVDNGLQSSTVEMVDKNYFQNTTLSEESVEQIDKTSVEQIENTNVAVDENTIVNQENNTNVEQDEAPVVETTEEKNVFEKLQQIYLSSNRNFNEILESEDKSEPVYASALYVKLKEAGLNNEDIKTELDNILAFSLTFTDMDEETWESLFGKLLPTIDEFENVMDYYYPLAIYVHLNECDLEHTPHEFDESRLTCAALEEINSQAFVSYSNSDYIVEMIKSSQDEELIAQYNRIVSVGVDFDVALTELYNIYVLSQTPMCIDEDIYNELFKNLIITVGEYDNVFEVYNKLACYVHELNCDYEHYVDEYGTNVCEGMKLEYTYEN